MNFVKQLRILKEARDQPALLALATVDLVHHTFPSLERTWIKDALLAAAVPHWCDPAFLATLLKITKKEATHLFSHLLALKLIEPFPARGAHAVNVHEATRLALRDHLRTTDPARWNILSKRAISYVRQSKETHSRIEEIYHLFATDQRAAIIACEALHQEFINTRNPEAQHALILVVAELSPTGWVTEAAKVVALDDWQESHDSREKATQASQRRHTHSSPPLPTRLLLVDDHEMVRRGLRALLDFESDMTIVGEAATVAEAVRFVNHLPPQMVLLDVKLPDGTVAESCRQLLTIAPKLRILILTSYAEDTTVMSAVQNGAHGYVLKDVRMDDLIHAIRTVASGHGYLDPRVTQQALHWMQVSHARG